MNENDIWNEKQNHPELVVQDCKEEFNLTEEQCEKLREILMRRGVNKWLRNRYLFINLKHRVKEMLKSYPIKSKEYRLIHSIYAPMHQIANSQRWVQWPKHVHKKMKQNIEECVVRGKSC